MKQKPKRTRPTIAMVKTLREHLVEAGREQRRLDEYAHHVQSERNTALDRAGEAEGALSKALGENARLRGLLNDPTPVNVPTPAVVDTLIAENVDFGRVTDMRFAVLVTALDLGHTLELRPTPESGDLWEVHAIRPA